MIDLSGQKFDRFIVIQSAKKDKWGKSQWLCLCFCGQTKIIRGTNLKSGNTKSCGCLQIEITRQRFTKHGHNKKGKPSKTYTSWKDMIQRCNNPNHKHYHYYGGRRISVCDRWKNSFENFLEDMGAKPANQTLDRIDNDKGYNKSNCKWSTSKQQAQNRRDTRLFTYDSRTQCLTAWAEEVGIKPSVLWKRFNRGWSIEKALTTKIGNKKNEKRNNSYIGD